METWRALPAPQLSHAPPLLRPAARPDSALRTTKHRLLHCSARTSSAVASSNREDGRLLVRRSDCLAPAQPHTLSHHTAQGTQTATSDSTHEAAHPLPPHCCCPREGTRTLRWPLWAICGRTTWRAACWSAPARPRCCPRGSGWRPGCCPAAPGPSYAARLLIWRSRATALSRLQPITLGRVCSGSAAACEE